MSNALEKDDQARMLLAGGKSARGKSEYVRHTEGKKLTRAQAMKAKCWECMGGYSDGRGIDCGIELCPLHPWMPYREGGARKSKVFTEEQKDAARERFSKALGRGSGSSKPPKVVLSPEEEEDALEAAIRVAEAKRKGK